MKIVMVGQGAFGRKHLDRLKNIDGVEVASLVGGSKESTEAVAKQYGIPHWTTNLSEALALPGIDAAILTSPTQMHARQAIEVMRAQGAYVELIQAYDARIGMPQLGTCIVRPAPTDLSCSTVLLYGFKRDLNAYLAATPAAPARTLAEIIAFNNAFTPPMKYGQAIAIGAEALDVSPGSADTTRYLADGISAGDFNRDGRMDVVAGPFWYEGPGFERAHEIYPAVDIPLAPTPSNSMFSYAHDFNGDGWTDVLRLGRVHLHPAVWFENPQGKPGPWKEHFVFERVLGESPPFVTHAGKPALVSHWQNRWGLLRPDVEPTKSASSSTSGGHSGCAMIWIPG